MRLAIRDAVAVSPSAISRIRKASSTSFASENNELTAPAAAAESTCSACPAIDSAAGSRCARAAPCASTAPSSVAIQ